MFIDADLEEYMAEIRKQVCSHCIEHPPGGPPCLPLGKRCGIEINLRPLIDSVHHVRSNTIDPYIDRFHEEVCTECPNRNTSQCPCALDYLLTLAVQAIETVDQRIAERKESKTQ
jgi:hypothetical protein